MSFQLFAQETVVLDKITLNTGEIYVGKIVLKTDDMIMLTTKEGERFQFQLSEIKKVESELFAGISKNDKTYENKTALITDNFGGIVEFSTGVSSAKYGFGVSPNSQLALIFGNRNVLEHNLFLGVGIGYNNTNIASGSNIGYLPLFVRIQSTLSKKRAAPFVGMDAGYAIALNSGFGGGALIKISAGITRKISSKTFFFAGVYAGIQTFSGTLTETFESNPYIYFGETTMKNIGIKTGLMF